MPIHPQEIAILLNLCPICQDIQFKILMLVIGINGTPTSNLFKAPVIYTFYGGNKKKFNYSTIPLKPSAYFRDLILLANLKFSYYSSDDDVDEEEDDDDDVDEEEDDDDDVDEDDDESPLYSYEADCETKLAKYEADFEIKMAYTLTYDDTSGNQYVSYMQELKNITKIRLNNMIASEPQTI
jgi:hypothetical protein